MRFSVRRCLLATAAALLLAGLGLAVPSVAQAAVDPFDPATGHVGVEADGTLSIAAGYASTSNRITIRPYNGRWRIVDENFPIWATADCIMLTDHEVECGRGSTITGLFVDLGQSDDTFVSLLTTRSINNAKLYGGDGNDVIYAGPGTQQVFGGNGDDQLFGGCASTCADGKDVLFGQSGADSLNGGAGNDDLTGGPGADTYVGGSGDGDLVSYVDKEVPVMASLNDVADDGVAGELENIPSDVEHLAGGWNNDVLVGNDFANVLYGNSGYDRMYGYAGGDFFYGGNGGDFVDGGWDSDIMYGGPGDDTLMGGTEYDKAHEYPGEGYDTCQAPVHENCEKIVE